MQKANQREKVFLLRLYQWRSEQAEKKNYSKEMILPAKLIGHIAKGMRSGKKALKGNRRLPDKIIDRYWSTFEAMYQEQPTAEELAVLEQIKTYKDEDPQKDLLYEILYSVIKYKCLDEGIDVSIAFPRADLKLIKEDVNHADVVFKNGWRQEFFGKTFNTWLKNSPHLEITVGPETIELSMNGHA
jgi:ribonuclease D